MRALRYHGTKDLRVDDIPEPRCLDHQVKVRPAFCGICGTDLHEYSSPTFVPQPGNPHVITGEVMPIGVGHEFSGEVVELGSKVSGIKVGDRVAVQPTICCFSCEVCQDDGQNICPKGGFVGLSGWGGGMSDVVCVDAKLVFPLPEQVSLEVGGEVGQVWLSFADDFQALVEPLAVAWHAVDASDIKPGMDAIVMGAGPIGLGVIQCLKARGANQIIVVELAKERQNFAKHFGATRIIDPRSEDVVKVCKELCGGKGPHIAMDCAGVAASLTSATLAVRPRGVIVNVAIWEKETSFHPNNLVFGEKKYTAVLGYNSKDYRGVIQALGQGKMKPDAMITGIIKIDRVVEDGYRALIEEKDKHVKILVDSRA
ncbi:hypothetical protein R6Q59_009979 [Mikania micrantha]